MPRLPTSLLRRARHEHSLLPLLFRTCRDLPSARNELRWLREHILETASPKSPPSTRHQRLYELCLQRSKGKPLQYILGSQPFGNLEILCKPGVLIPRPETDLLTTHLAQTLLSYPPLPPTIHILDLCTGTGCIPLLLHSLLHPSIPHPHIHIHGIDISPLAMSLARKNLHHNTRHLHPSSQISFQQADIFDTEWLNGIKAESSKKWKWDILISNPPYISPHAFNNGSTARSVRNYEPKIALVPTTPTYSSTDAPETGGDMFYPRLLHIANELQVGVFVVEVADMAQAKRVVGMVRERGAWEGVEVWRDFPEQGGRDGTGEVVEVDGRDGRDVRVRGEGEGRAVVAWREGWGGVFEG
ncbi:hypothetical protein JMJ35_005038 [Cladonia borealis]|uniref:Methyltransferase domain-containing protein n=1 Tax=Cladonia borealis TaxID=184061 RepID=A0AA39R3Z8_9LECA|nr:hypothetical protein JMJ35_005038 [Cladonia borealis]